ncbi:MAG: hypothetical protein PHF60_00425 [Candidatus ainarchaeum sp.]|nr:hypothetical protein [Candidatus ainarchaeum sp.]
MDKNDILSAAASLAVLALLVVLVIAAVMFLFTFGSPLVLLGAIMAAGVLGLIVLFGIAVALIGVWYVIYALMKSYFGPKEESKSKGNYTLERLKKA